MQIAQKYQKNLRTGKQPTFVTNLKGEQEPSCLVDDLVTEDD